LDKLKSQIGNLKNINIFFQIAARNKFEKSNLKNNFELFSKAFKAIGDVVKLV
jgi:hypothetical protein